ncbi:MAG: hypothetical protein HY692_01445 [Cyanobacteria bacterium NC_groundwater_1444_Ag_S-0.65um_54_12]|nr:hypothetical protein [Cyanobacteria bacterium NC_groundwater_1444_Ag_S-0.65um_54_12]
MKIRTAPELEELAIRIMQSGSKTCPDCARQVLSSSFDEHYWKLQCPNCGFHYEDYMGGA